MASKNQLTSKNSHCASELGWIFNNEIVLILRELKILNKTSESLEIKSSAINKRIEGLDAIKEFITRQK